MTFFKIRQKLDRWLQLSKERLLADGLSKPALQVLEKISACETAAAIAICELSMSQSSHVSSSLQLHTTYYTTLYIRNFPEKEKKKECVHRVMRTFPYKSDVLSSLQA